MNDEPTNLLRYLKKTNGEVVLQQWWNTPHEEPSRLLGGEWRDVPIVEEE